MKINKKKLIKLIHLKIILEKIIQTIRIIKKNKFLQPYHLTIILVIMEETEKTVTMEMVEVAEVVVQKKAILILMIRMKKIKN